MTNRREFIRLTAAGLSLPVFAGKVRMWQMTKDDDLILTEEALRIHRSALIVDGHNDFAEKIRGKGFSSFEKFDFMQNQPEFQTDIPRLKKGGIGAQFWAADGWTPNNKENDKSSSGYCLEDIGMIYKMAEKYPSVFEMAYSANDILRIHSNGKIASLIGIEGGFPIESSLNILDSFFRLGARYMTLSHADTNDLTDSASDKPKFGGLSQFGEKVVSEMNRLGMMVDISHISSQAMRHVLRIAQAPIIASHSSAFALASSTRNIPDDVLYGISKNEGIIMVNFWPGYLTEEGAKASESYWDYARIIKGDPHKNETEINTLLDKWSSEHPVPECSVEKVVDHIEYIAKTAGIDHVGLGSDFDGITSGPDHLSDVSYFPYITQILLNRGYNEGSIHKILGGNFIRVFQKVEESARKLKV